jgi:transcriptional regulator with XRE-family HTH domain
MRGKRNDGKPTVRPLPRKRMNVTMDPIPGSIGALLRKERVERQIAQGVIAKKIAKNGRAYNGRMSEIELGKVLPTDSELAALAGLLKLSLPTLRAKRDASKVRTREKKKKGKTVVINAPRPAPRLAAKTVAAPPPAPPDPAGPPAVADWIELVDNVVRMPIDPGDRKRWFAATMELFALRVKL